jgi:hypothetical protein
MSDHRAADSGRPARPRHPVRRARAGRRVGGCARHRTGRSATSQAPPPAHPPTSSPGGSLGELAPEGEPVGCAGGTGWPVTYQSAGTPPQCQPAAPGRRPQCRSPSRCRVGVRALDQHFPRQPGPARCWQASAPTAHSPQSAARSPARPQTSPTWVRLAWPPTRSTIPRPAVASTRSGASGKAPPGAAAHPERQAGSTPHTQPRSTTCTPGRTPEASAGQPEAPSSSPPPPPPHHHRWADQQCSTSR